MPKALAHDPIATPGGRQIKAARVLLGMSAAQLAHAAGLQNWHVHFVEVGRPCTGERPRSRSGGARG